jgi:hypothetical protein
VIYEWKLDGHIRNFGDALHEVLVPQKQHYDWYVDTENMHFLLGSVIDNAVIKHTLQQGLRPVFHGCGWRGNALNEDLVKQCEFIGVRGPHTQDELSRCGIETTVTKDPAYQLPHLVAPGEPNGFTLVVRHLLDQTETTPNSIHEMKADAIFRPTVEDRADIIEFVQKISGARFVLTGAMHAAIVAHAYGVPFALLDTGYIDCPPKWADWLASVNLGSPVFVDNIVEGREWYNAVKLDAEHKEN